MDELDQRMAFYGLAGEAAAMRRVGRRIGGHIDTALRAFYARVAQTPELARLFTSEGQADRARSLQKDHWRKLFGEGLTESHAQQARVIGTVHARIGLKPQWYIGGYAVVLEHLIHGMIAPGLLGLLPWRRRQARDLSVLVKAALIDMDLALSTYSENTGAETRQVLGTMSAALSGLARGDLSSRMEALPGEFGQAEQDFNAAVAALQEAMNSVVTGVRSISTASSEIRAATDDLALRNEQQAASLEEAAAAMNEVTTTVRESAERTVGVQAMIANAHAEATNGGKVVSNAITAMAAIEKSAQEITQIINVIDGIAFQTNLLALNAGVEAARAGDAGKGFAVVANEVRALAQRSADAAKDIKELITASTEQVAGGVRLVGETGDLLGTIVTRVGEIDEVITEIARSTEGQASNLLQVNSVVSEMDRMTQQNAAMVEQSTAAARSLADDARGLAELVGRFRTGAEVSAALPARKVETGPHRARAAPPPLPVAGNLAVAASFQPDADDWSEF